MAWMYYIDALLTSPLSGCLLWFSLPCLSEYMCVWSRKQHLVFKSKQILWLVMAVPSGIFLWCFCTETWNCCGPWADRPAREHVLLLSPRDSCLHIFPLIFRFLGAPAWLWQAKCFCRTLAFPSNFPECTNLYMFV